MKTFFNPSSIAVVGASDRKGGHQILKNLLHGYKGAVYGVNPRHRTIEGVPCCPSVEEIPFPVDLAIVLVPAPSVPSVLEGCAKKGVGRVMIESAGFAEVGEKGRMIQAHALSVAREAGIRIWGPNCMGLVDVGRRHFFTFMSPLIYEDGLMPGDVSLIAQSGMLSAAFLADLSRRTLGIGKVCSIGNKADVDECDILEHLLSDPDTKAVALYLESIPRARLFAEMAARSTKPIVVLKGGRSEAGARAAMSHTSSLSGDSRLLDGVLEMSGVTLARDFYQMIDVARALAENPAIPPPWRTAVLTFSGGAGILSCDLMQGKDLEVAELSVETKEALNRVFPQWMPASNPVDLYPAIELHGRLETYLLALSAVMNDPKVDAVLIHYVAGLDDNLIDMEALKKKADEAGKKVVFWVLGREGPTRAFRRKAESVGLRFYDEIHRAIECLSAAARYQSEKRPLTIASRDAAPTPRLQDLRSASPEDVWDEYESKRLLERFSLPVVEEFLADTLEEALLRARELGFPVALKGLIPGEIHKTERGLVRLNLASPGELESAYFGLQKKLEGRRGRILLQRQVQSDYELIAGFIRDEQFGPCLMFGLGGIFAELQKDVVFSLAPLSRAEALKLIDKIRGRRILDGLRGTAPLDRDRMAEILVNLGDLGVAHPEIEQIDVNPLAVHDGAPVAVDAAVVLRPRGGGRPKTP